MSLSPKNKGMVLNSFLEFFFFLAELNDVSKSLNSAETDYV